MQRHDVLVLTSDGVSDNLWDWEVGEVVGRLIRLPASSNPATPLSSPSLTSSTSTINEETKWHVLPRLLSEAIARRAYERSRYCSSSPKEDSDTPFSMRARGAGHNFSGGKGKSDDISVVVGVVLGA